MHRTPAVALVIALVIAGGAAAFWRGAGTGAAEVRVQDMQPLTLSSASASALLTPGGVADVALIVNNPNPFEVTIEDLHLDPTAGAGTGGFEVDPGHAGCDVAALSVAPQDNGGTGWTVPPRTGDADGTLSINLADGLAMAEDASDACQGATFAVHLAADDSHVDPT